MLQTDNSSEVTERPGERGVDSGSAALQAVVDRIKQRVARLERRTPPPTTDPGPRDDPRQAADTIAQQVSQRLARLRGERSEPQRPNTELFDALAARRKALDQCVDALERRSKAVENGALELARRAAQLQDDRENLDRDRADFETRRRELDLRIDAIALQKRQVEGENARIEQELAAIEHRSRRLGGRREALQARIARLARDRDAVALRRRAVESRERDAAQRETLAEETERRLADREQALRAAESALEREQAAIAARNEEFRKRRLELAKLRDTLQSEEKTLHDEQARLGRRRGRIARVRERLQARVRDARQGRARVARVERHVAERASNAARRIDQLDQRERTLNELESELEARGHALSDRGRELAEFEARIARQAEELEAARTRLSEAEHARERLQRRIARLRARRDAVARQGRALEARQVALADNQAKLSCDEAELASREARLCDRRRELDAALETLDARAARTGEVEHELDGLDRRLEERRAQAEQTRAEIESQAATLEERAHEVDGLAGEMERREARLREEERRLGEAEADLASRRAALEARRSELSNEWSDSERQWRESLGQRREIDHSLTALADQEAALERRRRSLTGDELQCAALESGLRERRERLAEQNALLDEEAARLSESRLALDAEHAALREVLERTAAERAACESEHAIWLQSQGESIQPDEGSPGFVRLWAELAALKGAGQALRSELSASQADWSAARDGFAGAGSEAAALAETGTSSGQGRDTSDLAARLDRRDQEIAAHLERAARLEQERATLEERRVAAERLYAQATLIHDEARRSRGELDGLREELATQRAELQRAILQLEIDRNHLNEIRRRIEQDRDDVQEAARHIAARVREYGLDVSPDGRQVSVRGRLVRGLWLRTALASVALGAAAGAAWLVTHPEPIRTQIMVSGRDADAVWPHTVTLGDPKEVERWLSGADAAAWSAALRERRAAVHSDPASLRLTLRMDGMQPELDAALLKRLAARFANDAPSLQPPIETSEAWISWHEQLGLLEREHAQWLAELATIDAARAAIPASDEYSATVGEIVELQRALDGLRRELNAARERAAALAREPRPTGVVAAETLETARRGDAIYQEDLKEFDSQSKLFRRELGVAMLLVSEPVRALREALKTFEKLTNEQIELNPPDPVRFELEELVVATTEFDRMLARFLQEWDQRIIDLERMSPAEQVLQLFDAQRAAHDGAKEALGRAQQSIDKLRQRLRDLVERPDVGTRGMVVTSVLRGELARLEERTGGIAETIGGLDPLVNVQLDATQRQLRGIRSRILKRAGDLTDDLQRAADEAAAEDYDLTLAEARERVRELDEQRDGRVSQLLGLIDKQRSIERRDDDLKSLESQRRAVLAALERLDDQRIEVLACEPRAAVPTFETGPVSQERLIDPRRQEQAAYAGGAAFGATWLLGGLLAIGGRRGRRGGTS